MKPTLFLTVAVTLIAAPNCWQNPSINTLQWLRFGREGAGGTVLRRISRYKWRELFCPLSSFARRPYTHRIIAGSVIRRLGSGVVLVDVNNAGKVPAQKCYRLPQTLTWMRWR